MKCPVQPAARGAPRAGMSIVEVIVALLLLAAGILAVTSAGSAVIKQFQVANTEVEFWGALQTVGDSLQQLGYGNITAGSDTVGNYIFAWTVDAVTETVDVVTIAGSVTAPVMRSDTVLLYLTDID